MAKRARRAKSAPAAAAAPAARARRAARPPIELGGVSVPAGSAVPVDFRLARLPTAQQLPLRTMVVHGRHEGPGLWLSAAIHGDELNGVEIIRRVLESLDPNRLRGTVIAVPIVNAFGFLQQSRYLPDRRDLNRSFPGSEKGSLASRVAHLFLHEIVDRCDYGIDLHTAAIGRANLPQIRTNLDDPPTAAAALAFGAPVAIHARTRDGSLRAAALARGKKVLLYECGEPLRYDEDDIALGVRGVRAVMAMAGMGVRAPQRKSALPTRTVRRSTWLRAPRAGLARMAVRLGSLVREGDPVAIVAGPFGGQPKAVRAPHDGLIIGVSTNPAVYQGDALAHLAVLETAD